MDNIIIILGSALILAALVIMNAAAVRCVRRLILVNYNTGISKGIISEFDNINSYTVEYDVNGVKYSGVCGVSGVKDGILDLMIGREKARYSVGDEVDVHYNILNPSKFLIDGGREFYKARAVKIFLMDAAIPLLIMVVLLMRYYMEF